MQRWLFVSGVALLVATVDCLAGIFMFHGGGDCLWLVLAGVILLLRLVPIESR